ncbi:MAG TPA: hypothetical protein VFY65_10250 [Longimicrobium sp.]|nr:hypothetical protein [Longimicrobium sp.]
MTRRLFILALLMVAAACGSSQVAPEDRPRTRSDRLTQEEILRTQMSSMFDVVQRLQPGWLIPQRERGLPSPIGVFMDGVRVGNADFLRQIPSSQVSEARFLSNRDVAAELTRSQQTGIGSAIMLTSRRQ